jgi:hypothetical protein
LHRGDPAVQLFKSGGKASDPIICEAYLGLKLLVLFPASNFSVSSALRRGKPLFDEFMSRTAQAVEFLYGCADLVEC